MKIYMLHEDIDNIKVLTHNRNMYIFNKNNHTITYTLHTITNTELKYQLESRMIQKIDNLQNIFSIEIHKEKILIDLINFENNGITWKDIEKPLAAVGITIELIAAILELIKLIK